MYKRKYYRNDITVVLLAFETDSRTANADFTNGSLGHASKKNFGTGNKYEVGVVVRFTCATDLNMYFNDVII